MNIHSMTGRGSGKASNKDIYVEVEISSLNRKHLDISLQFPKPLVSLEPLAVQEINHVLTRGKITGEVRMENREKLADSCLQINEKLAQSYLHLFQKMEHNLKLKNDLTLSTLFRFPGVISFQQEKLDTEQFWPIIRKALRDALNELISMRKTEGLTLQKDIVKRLTKLQTLSRRIAERVPLSKKQYLKRIRDTLLQNGLNVSSEDERVLKEVVLFAERSDITEELVRLDSHINQAEKIISSGKPVGRRLDFLAQEMFREINTVGAKSSDAKMGNQVVFFKVELEKMREQIQNVE